MPGTPFQGPNTNLAGLFQINGVGTVNGGLTQTWNTWQIGKAAFGSGASMLTVYVVKGTAPAVVPDTGLERISNAGHLLYFYSGDAKPGDTIGASIPSWGAVSPAGVAIHAT